MDAGYRPAGYNRVSPYLIVNGAAATIEFMIRVFQAQEIRRFPAGKSKIMHAEVRLGDSVVMLADPPENRAAVAAHVHVYVPGVDETYRLALAAGAESVQEPAQMEDEDRQAGVRDAGGTTWWIATKVN
jgi:uncharacterized glyoxalase superfamily protein PhnB